MLKSGIPNGEKNHAEHAWNFCTSLKTFKVTRKAVIQQQAAIKQGNKYGCSLQTWPENTRGKCSYGRENEPPMKGL